jgi:large subunit ribosomal protein L3
MKSNKKVLLLLGRKLGMARLCDSSGNSFAVTAIRVARCPVVKVRRPEKDGYAALQIAAEPLPAFRLSGAEAGHFAKNNCQPHRHLREIRVESVENYSDGEIFDLSCIAEGELVDIAGITKGHGFQGVMKRYGFSGGPASHGSMFHRRGGSYGQREEPGRVYPGRKMPGHMGAVRRTVQNLPVVRICAERQIFFVRGSVTGCNGGLLCIRTAKKG